MVRGCSDWTLTVDVATIAAFYNQKAAGPQGLIHSSPKAKHHPPTHSTL